MSSVLGVSVGGGTVRVALPFPGNSAERFAPIGFDVQALPVTEERPVGDVAADTIGAVLGAHPAISATAIAYRTEAQGRALRSALARRQLTGYQLVPELNAAREFLRISGELQGYRTVAIYDLGSSGLSVSIVDVASGKVSHSERRSDISGDYLDLLIREQQIASGRIQHPPTAEGLAALDDTCRRAKEALSSTGAVSVESPQGTISLSRENLEALIMLAVESSARMTHDVITRSDQTVQAVFVIGGCARIPLIAKTLERWIGMPAIVPGDPETVTVRGAALLARPGLSAGSDVALDDSSSDVTMQMRAVRPAGAASRRLFDFTGSGLSGNRRRTLNIAGIGISALIVISAIGIGLGWGQTPPRGDSQSSSTSASTSVPTSTTSTPSPAAPPPATEPTNAAVAPPAPQDDAEPHSHKAPAPAPKPPAILVPGLPPIMVPTLPPVVLPQIPGQ
ncbi:MAG: Hsp70 family protein [Nocardia sp.]|nr:Hsp70 family protein [Nocardia sp.]